MMPSSPVIPLVVRCAKPCRQYLLESTTTGRGVGRSKYFSSSAFASTTKHDEGKDDNDHVSKTHLRRMKVAELRTELIKRGLDSSGLKPLLQGRLSEAIFGDSATSDLVKNVSDKGGLEQAKGRPKWSPNRTYILRFRGFASSIHESAGVGLILYDIKSNQPIWEGAKYFPQEAARFDAEYKGIVLGLKVAYNHGIRRLVLQGDNHVIMKQLFGNFHVQKLELQRLYWAAVHWKEKFDQFELHHINPSENGDAQLLATKAVASRRSYGLEGDTECKPIPISNGGVKAPSRTEVGHSIVHETSSPIQVGKKYLLRFDGGSRGNPGIAGAGMVIYDDDDGKEVWCGWKFLETRATNTEAEYTALVVGLQCAKALGITNLRVEGDSKVILKQLSGAYNLNGEAWKELSRPSQKLIESFDGKIEVGHIMRNDNKRADQLANQAMDSRESFGIKETEQLSTSTALPFLFPVPHELEETVDEDIEVNCVCDPLSPIQPSKQYLLRFDGGSRGNPGIAGAGVVIYDNESREEVWCGWKFLRHRTNNEAEYIALIVGLQCAKALGITDLRVEGDSQLVVRQLTGEYKVKAGKLLKLFQSCKNLVDNFEGTVEIGHVLRTGNTRADQLANKAMDSRESFGVTENSQHSYPSQPPIIESVIDVPNIINADESLAPIQPNKQYLLRFDGGARETRGVAGAGVVICDNDSGEEVWCGWKFLENCTNNEAEYMALIVGLQCAKALGIADLRVEGDSQLIIRQLAGDYMVKAARLKELHKVCKNLVASFGGRIEILHIMRSENKRADQLARQAMNSRESFGFMEASGTISDTFVLR